MSIPEAMDGGHGAAHDGGPHDPVEVVDRPALAHDPAAEVTGPHGVGDQGDDHGHDDHAQGEMGLGPIDWPMWGVGVLGVALALVVTFCLVLATGFSFSA